MIEGKDIGLLSQKPTVAGTEPIPVSDTQFITPNQIAGLVPVDAELSDTSEHSIQNKAVTKKLQGAAFIGEETGNTAPDSASPIKGITMNGSPVTVTNGVANLGTVLTEHQSLTGLATEDYVDDAIGDALGDIETLLAAI